MTSKLRIPHLKVVTVAGALVLCGAINAAASPITFNFDILTDSSTNANVQTYMNSVLSANSAGSVIVTGADVDTTYSGDGHVVGNVNGHNVTSITLGPDAFLDTYTNSQITMAFSSKIYSVSFNYEIFPNGTCTDLSTNWQGKYTNCGGGLTPTNLPDFTFRADNVQYLFAQAATPTGLTHSPNSGWFGTEMAPQLGPTASGTFNFANGVNTLTFIDWPATIGIDDLVITTTTGSVGGQSLDAVPEPGSLILLGTGLVAAAAGLRRRFAR